MAQEIVNSVEGEGEAMKLLLTIPDVNCFKIEMGRSTLIGFGPLEILEMLTTPDTLFLFMPDIFNYAINAQFPSMKAGPLGYIFPAMNCFYGLVLPEKTPIEDVEMFEGLLVQYSQLQQRKTEKEEKKEEVVGEEEGEAEEAEEAEESEKAEEKPEAIIAPAKMAAAAASINFSKIELKEQKESAKAESSDKAVKYGKSASKWIQKGTSLAQKGIKKGAVLATKGIGKSKDYLKTQIPKEQKEVHVSDATKERIKKAKQASGGAVKISSKVANSAKTICGNMALKFTDAASKTELGQKIQSNKSERMETAKEIGRVTLVGVLAITEELEQASLLLIGEVADASADVAQHAYGDEVGGVAHDTADIIKNSANVAVQASQVSVVALAQTTATVASLDVLSETKDCEQPTKR